MTDQDKASQIHKRIGLILKQADMKATLYRYQPDQKAIFVNINQKPFVVPFERLPLVEPADEQFRLLTALYQNQDEAGKQLIVTDCEKILDGKLSFQKQVLQFLAHTQSLKHIVDLLCKNFKAFGIPDALTVCVDILACHHRAIPDADLDYIPHELQKAMDEMRKNLPEVPKLPASTSYGSPSIIRPLPPASWRERRNAALYLHDVYNKISDLVTYIRGQCELIQYLRLKRELDEGVNFEINQDREKLVSSLSNLRFSEKLSKFLEFSEQEFAKAATEFTFKTYVDQIRSFYAELLTETAEKIAALRKETLATVGVDKTRQAEVRDYLEATKFFSEQFKKLVAAHYFFMSDEGTHRLDSSKDVARIARNIAIEIGLLITKRLNEFKP